jgi:hypothetical protein
MKPEASVLTVGRVRSAMDAVMEVLPVDTERTF